MLRLEELLYGERFVGLCGFFLVRNSLINSPHFYLIPIKV